MKNNPKMHKIIKRLLLLCGFGTVGVVTHQRYIKPRPDADTQQVTTITQEATPPEQKAPKPPAIQEQPSSPTTQDAQEAPSLQALQLGETTATTPKAIKKPAAASQQATPLGVLDAALAPERIMQPIWWKPLTWVWREWAIATCTVGILVVLGSYVRYQRQIKNAKLQMIKHNKQFSEENKAFIKKLSLFLEENHIAHAVYEKQKRYSIIIRIKPLQKRLFSFLNDEISSSGTNLKQLTKKLIQNHQSLHQEVDILYAIQKELQKYPDSQTAKKLCQQLINLICCKGSLATDSCSVFLDQQLSDNFVLAENFSDPVIKKLCVDLTIGLARTLRKVTRFVDVYPLICWYILDDLKYNLLLYQHKMLYHEKLSKHYEAQQQKTIPAFFNLNKKDIQKCEQTLASYKNWQWNFMNRTYYDYLIADNFFEKKDDNFFEKKDDYFFKKPCYHEYKNFHDYASNGNPSSTYKALLTEQKNLYLQRTHPILEYFPYTLMECYKDNKERNLPQPPHYDLQCLVGQYMLSFYEQQHNEATCVHAYWQKRTESEEKYDLYEDRLIQAEAHLSETQKYTNAYKHFANIPAGEQKTKMFAYLCACEYQKIQDDCAQLAQEQKNNFDYYSDKQVEYEAKTSSSLRAEIRELQTGALLWTLSNNMDIKPTEDVLMITKCIMHACDEVTFVLPEKAAHIFPSAGCEDSREAYVAAKPALDKIDLTKIECIKKPTSTKSHPLLQSLTS